MIYNESTKSFIKLETALKELGFDQQTIDLALEYLDITKPRNNDLMRKNDLQRKHQKLYKA